MDEQTAADLKELTKEIRKLEVFMVRIDERLNNVERVEKLAQDGYTMADKADDKAAEALSLAKQNAISIDRMANTIKWSIGTLASITVPLTIFVLARVFG